MKLHKFYNYLQYDADPMAVAAFICWFCGILIWVIALIQMMLEAV